MQRLFTLYILALFFVYQYSYAQDPNYSILIEKLKNTEQDTARIKLLFSLSDMIPDGDWEKYNREMQNIAERNLKSPLDDKSSAFYKRYLATAINNKGLGLYYQGNYTEALIYYNKGLQMRESISDTAGIAESYSNISGIYDNKSDNTKSIEYLFKALRLYEKTADKKGVATTLNNIGYEFDVKGELQKALDYYSKSQKIRESIGDIRGMSNGFGNMAKIYADQGNIPKALEYDFKALALKEKIKEKMGEALLLGNIGVIYRSQKKMPEALEYFNKSLTINIEINNKKGTAATLSNIGAIYFDQGDFTKAIGYYEQSLKIRKEIGYVRGVSLSFVSLGEVYKKQRNLSKALTYFNSALATYQKIEDKEGIATCLNNIARIYLDQGKYKPALDNANEAMQISKKQGYRPIIRNAAFTLKNIYGALNKTKEALSMYDLYISMRDSISNNETEKLLTKQQFKHEYEIKATADSIKVSEEKKVASSKLAQEKTKNYALFGGLGLVMLFSVFMVNRFRITYKQKKLIEIQKSEVEEKSQLLEVKNEEINHKNTQITDSIRYARNIQQSVLASEDQLKHFFKEYFSLYLPKDIVSGDFYWLHQDSHKIWFALVDCTGHGVPGAFMSIMANSLLDKIIKEDKVEKPNDILKTLSYALAEKYRKQQNTPDGMEIALCLVDKSTNSMQLSIAGSNVYHIRKGVLTELKGDHMPIGVTEFIKDKGYTLHELNYEEGDHFYFFTDGYADQKGEQNKKKFYYKPFRDLLLKNSEQAMPVQKEELLQAHLTWKGKLSQNDDISVIGFRI